jgi:hypothetical protein
MKNLLTFVCLLMGYFAVAQEQVTDFVNVSFESPNRVQKLDTINGKLLFFISQAEYEWGKLWITDGAPENTHKLTDAEGVEFEPGTRAIRAFGYLYLIQNHVYRTKGNVPERVLPKSDSLYALYGFNNKLLLYFNKEKSTDTERIYLSSFNWLNADNTITRFADNVLRYQIVDSMLHYIRMNYKTRNLELFKLDKNGHTTKNVIFKDGVTYINDFKYLSRNGHDFYFFDTDKGRKLISKPAEGDDDTFFMDWGGNSYFPYTVSDTTGQLYFLNHFGGIKLFAVQNNNQLIEKWSTPIGSLALGSGDIYGDGVQYRNFKIIGNKLVFNSTRGSEGINSFFLNVFNLKTGINKRSKNMVAQFMSAYWDVNISEVDTNTYIIDNLVGKKNTYSFLKDTITNIENYPYVYPQQIDTLLRLNQETLLLKNNIYTITKGVKTPLLPTRYVFKQDQTQYFCYRTLGDKIVFWKYNPVNQHTEIWASKGEKNDARLIADIEEYFDYYRNWIIERNGKLIFYVVNSKGKMLFYETDGTKAGTIKTDETKELTGMYIDNILVNNKYAVIRLNDQLYEGNILVLEDGKVRLVNFSIRFYYHIYLTDNDIYLSVSREGYEELYKVVGNEVKLIDSKFQGVINYPHIILYSKTVATEDDGIGLFTVDAVDKPKRFLEENITYFRITGNKLLYNQRINQQPVFSVLDILTQKVEINKLADSFSEEKYYLQNRWVLRKGNEMHIVTGSNTKVFDIGFTPIFGFLPFAKGVLIMGLKDLYYYDLTTDTPTRILRNQIYNPDLVRNYIKPENEYVLIQLDKGNNIYQWAHWSANEKRLNEFNEDITAFGNVSKTGLFSFNYLNTNRAYWNYNGTKLVEKYKVPQYDPSLILGAGTKIFMTIVLPETGGELYQIGTESLMAYPEIVKGTEGVDVRSVFEFNKQIYIYGFTPTNGWQVWKMPDPNSVVIEPQEPLAIEPALESPVIYPNPSQDWLYVKTEKSLPYRLINTKGQLLMQGNLMPDQGIDIKQLSQGVYLLQLFDRGNVYVKKVVKE